MVLITLLCLTGCATVPMTTAPLNQNISWLKRKTTLEKIQHWHTHGVLSIRYQQRAQTANVNLIQTGQQYHMTLYGPLGTNSVVLDGEPGKVTMKTSDGEITTATSPEALLQQRLGWSLPVTNMYYWLRGLPAPHIPQKIHFDTFHHIKKLQQQHWVIQYLRYAGIAGNDLPTKIIMNNAKLRVIIIITQWQL